MLRAIVGFDPGVTSGVAVISLNGEVLLLKSFRNSRFDELVGGIADVAKPVIVATDVSPPAHSAIRLSKTFGATLYYPTISLTVAEKQNLTSKEEVGDLHQRDALASAMAAYKTYRPMIDKIRQKSGSKYELVFEKIMRGEANKIEDALIEKIRVETPQKSSSLSAQLKIMKLNRDHLAEKAGHLAGENRELQSKLKQLRAELQKFVDENYRHVAADKKVKSLETQLHNLQANDRLLFQRAKLAEGKLEAIEAWLSQKKGELLRVEKEGEGLHIGDLTLVEDAREKLKKVIEEHRSRKA